MPPLILETARGLKALVGRECAVTDWFRVTQARIEQFAEATEGHQWIHEDRERARRESPYGDTIAHGFLTLSLLSKFLKDAIEVRAGTRMRVNYGLNRARFPSPVRADSNVRARFTVQAVKELPGGVEAVFAVTVEGEGAGKPCCVAEWVVRYYD